MFSAGLKGALFALIGAALCMPTPTSLTTYSKASIIDGLELVPPFEDQSVRMPEVRVDSIRKIRCSYKDGQGHGTAYVVAQDTLLTANHVVEGGTDCFDGASGEPVTVVSQNAALDYAVLKMPTKKIPFMKLDCTGFVANKTYYSIGYAGVGSMDLMITRLRASGTLTSNDDSNEGVFFTNMEKAEGVLIQGMSGGPVIDDKGRVVGMNNATANDYKDAMLRPMSDTYFCSGKKSS